MTITITIKNTVLTLLVDMVMKLSYGNFRILAPRLFINVFLPF